MEFFKDTVIVINIKKSTVFVNSFQKRFSYCANSDSHYFKDVHH